MLKIEWRMNMVPDDYYESPDKEKPRHIRGAGQLEIKF